MSGIPEENFYRVTHLVLNEVPAHLRNLFKLKWGTKYSSNPWDDTATSGQLFLQRERSIKDQGIKSSVQNGNTNKWDGTVLFAVLLYSSHKLLDADSNAMTCVNDLRKLRNTCYGHLDCAKIEDSEYQNIIQGARNTFAMMNWPLTGISVIETIMVLVTHDFQPLLNEMRRERSNNKQLETELRLIYTDVRKVEKEVKSFEKLRTDVLSTKDTIGEVYFTVF